MSVTVWQKCLEHLQDEFPGQQFNTWIRPLQSQEKDGDLVLLAPNQFVLDWVNQRFLQRINELLNDFCDGRPPQVLLQIGCKTNLTNGYLPDDKQDTVASLARTSPQLRSNLNLNFTFDNFVVGKSNELARAAALQVAENPGIAYNPLLFYGVSGLGKTHLAHAIGNLITRLNPHVKVVYIHSERFVTHMVRALQTNTINQFKEEYRSVNVLLIDDIQFFAGKDRTQEEIFHIFNYLLELQQQIILTCDRYPKEINGLEERLKSRFGWGLTVAIDPPELETRVAILMSKAEQASIDLPHEVAFFIARLVRSNVRELEGVLKRVVASAQLTGRNIDLDLARDSLKDLLSLQDKLIRIENIQKVVAEYFKIKVSDLLSKRRNRSITRPRQVAMALAKELTNHSLPEIGQAFSGRDHTTVLHACRKINELCQSSHDVKEDYHNLLRILST